MTKVAVLGAAGGIGQPLSLLLKLDKAVTDLSLFDVVNVPGVGADLSHINTDAKVSYHLKSDNNGTGLQSALQGADIVIIPAGVPRKPGMTRDDLFKINGGICADLATGIATTCPDALVLVISNPVNSTVPIFAEVFKKHGSFNANKLFGVTWLDTVRANTFIAQATASYPTSFKVKVVGGHSGDTIVPLYSVTAADAYAKLSNEEESALIHRVQFGGDEVVQAKQGAGSATLSMAYAGYRFLKTFLNAKDLEEPIVESCYISLDESVKGAKETKAYLKELTGEDIEFFAMPCKLGSNGVESIEFDLLKAANDKERQLINVCANTLTGNINKGVSFIRGN
ncbi:unnamed protein product [Ambrosiozyma monospora]|uniref:Unnamed protein product n=1 Tax=Ambrosiozyma monospora TaxID=43982 RepID=A0ACB5TC12_AMBMO|nr:unnamed protein product [Ambrosiozyma monospora]